ncbi:MAG: cation-transporting P-type ATPase [Chloroflexota bacterium]|nr:MAG: cation-transporting P-type ATPase [Chloroflexota bacterium]
MINAEERPWPGVRPNIGKGSHNGWYSLSLEDIFTRLRVSPSTGLRTAEVPLRQQQYGYNLFGDIEARNVWQLLLQQFKSIVVLLLIIATVISWFLGEYLDSAAIAAALILNALFGFVTEARAESALLALKRLAVPTARVRRGGEEQEIAATDLVPGDIVILTPGSLVPADGRLIESHGLLVEEAALTGESAPIAKSLDILPPEAPLAERSNMVYLGTAVAGGNAVAVITATGQSTELGHIGRLVAAIPREETPLSRAVEGLGRQLIWIILVVSALVIGIGVLHAEPIGLMLRTGISLAIAAVPEGLPAVTTIALALGLRQLVRRNCVVRRLSSVETLGSTTVICTDKTGTLTTNMMTVRELWLPPDRRIHVTGAGYEPAGQFLSDDQEIDPRRDRRLSMALRVGTLCNNATLEHDPQVGWHIHGDPSEAALIVAAQKAGLDHAQLVHEFPREAEEPFNERAKRMATVHRMPKGGSLVCVKGAPQVVVPLCRTQLIDDSRIPVTHADREHALRQNDALAQRGLRVLCLAYRIAAERIDVVDAERDLCFVGLVGIADPPRTDAGAAVEQCGRAGIRVVMITGDQKATACAIARELGMLGNGEPIALEPRQLLGLNSGRQLPELARVNVFARVSPEDKLSIVRALQRNGEVVAVTGDGVNDALALKAADIGIAIGRGAADVAKEAADLIITDERLSTIVTSIRQGRIIYDNIRRAIRFLLTASFSTILAILLGIVFELGLPLLPLQILWLNLVVHVFPAMALTMERGEHGLMERPPRSPGEPILTVGLLGSILWRSLLIAATSMVAFAWSRLGSPTHEAGSTVAFAALSLALLLHVFNLRSERSMFLGELPATNRYLWLVVAVTLGLQLSGVYLPPLQTVLRTRPLSLLDWAVVGGCSILSLVLVEVVKLWTCSRTVACPPRQVPPAD